MDFHQQILLFIEMLNLSNGDILQSNLFYMETIRLFGCHEIKTNVYSSCPFVFSKVLCNVETLAEKELEKGLKSGLMSEPIAVSGVPNLTYSIPILFRLKAKEVRSEGERFEKGIAV